MNKNIVFAVLIVILIGFLSFANAKQEKDDLCKCKARAVKKCGFGKSSEACKCRSAFTKQCKTRCSLTLKCTYEISEKCLSFKKGSLEYKRCERSVSANDCVSKLSKAELYNCKCKTFARAVCGNCPSPTGVHCRDDAFESCKKQCGKSTDCQHHKKRVCISPPNCNCKSQATKKCAVAADPKGCFKSQFATCNKNCIAGTKCYSVSCKNAGVKRCAKAVAIACDGLSDDLTKYSECITKKSQRCQAYEVATCKKARRLFKYRAECDYIAKEKCTTLTGKSKCSCESQIRNKCVEEKKEQRKKFIRHSATCRRRAQELCDAKAHCKDVQACYAEETKHCIRRKHRRTHIVPPECVERVIDFCGSKDTNCYKDNIGKCTEIWLRRYCERKAYKDCDGDLPCMQSEVRRCKHKLPPCWKNRQLCNDNNKCTDDVCDPNVGCLNIQKSCSDNNRCTVDKCVPNVGCESTEVTCDDGVECTVDSCNAENGKCEHVANHMKCSTTDKCTTGYCTDKGCQYHKDDKCVTRQPPTCDCQPQICKTSSCQIQSDLSVKCIYTDKSCDDGLKCTFDYCDSESGTCQHTKIDSKECPSTSPSCKDDLDCSAWGVSQGLSCLCSVAACDAQLGICVPRQSANANCVTCDQCQKACAPRDACDGQTTSCTRDAHGRVLCNRPATSCDDESPCTKDSCNVNTGVCEHTFVKSDTCIDFCETDHDCIQWAISSNLDKECKTARCNNKLKACVVIDQIDQSKCIAKIPVCAKCVPTNACEDAECFYDSNGFPACRRTTKSCNDNNPCTTDTCNVSTGKCENIYQQSAECTPCDSTSQCQSWAANMKLASICKTGVCDAKLKTCVTSDIQGCTTGGCVGCTPSNKCESANCLLNVQGQPTCIRTTTVCNDNDDCTTDSCDESTGACVHTSITSVGCTKCQSDVDCSAWGESLKLSNVCREAYCNANGKCRSRASQNQSKCKSTLKCIDCLPLTHCDQAACVVGENGIPTCVHKQVNCDDGEKCTQDYCDSQTGKCIHNDIKSAECQQCKADVDCAQFSITQNLASKCQIAYCSNNFCRIRSSPDQSKCPAVPICISCDATPCETTQCVFGENGQPQCVRTAKSCDDGNKCTTDKCDASGKCVNTFFQSSQCQACQTNTDCAKWGVEHQLDATCKVPVCNSQGFCEAQQAADSTKCQVQTSCSKDVDCNSWAINNNLADQCLTAYCLNGACKSKPINDLTKCTPVQCKTCTPANACETVQCVNTDSGYICARKQKDCDDGITCTTDSCDATTGTCLHNSAKCTPCSIDTDCQTYATTEKLNNCQQAKCQNKICVTQPVADVTCVPQFFCDVKCPAKDKCHKSHCHYDANKNVVCDTQTTLTCNDNNDCTTDVCDAVKGCVNTFTPSEKCQKCSKDTDCSTYALNNNLNALCQTATCNPQGQCVPQTSPNSNCVPQTICQQTCATTNKCQSFGCSYDENKKVLCNYVVKTCNDGKECTQDYCDTNTGLCVHVQSDTCGPLCKTTLDCAQWANTNKLSTKCQLPFCDQTRGACVAVDAPDATKCPVPNCNQVCPSTKCQNFTCSYDSTKKVICTPSAVNCDDGDDCTVDSCDSNTGCVHKFIANDVCQQCTRDTDCSAWGVKLGACFTVTCDATKNKCVKKAVPGKSCNHPPPSCPACFPANKCQTAKLVQTLDACTCQISNVTCDDGISCTVDSCDASSGTCSHVFSTSIPQCTVPCQVDAQCGKWAIDNNLYANCQLAVCDTKSGSCVAQDDTKTNCKKCQTTCKPSSNCDSATCVWIGNKYQCQHSPKSCDDGKSCTVDSCDAKTGSCVHTYNCSTSQCNTDIDCAAWGQANQLSSKCLTPVCNQNLGSCQSVPDTKTCTFTCKQSSDCPPSKFGSVCDTNSGQCVPSNCTFDSDCLTSNTKPGVWNYCKTCNADGQKCCVPQQICVTNTDCDDKDPCTQDVCLSEYGFCRNVLKCDDNNECTRDIRVPSADGKTCTCSNPPISCTTDPSLINANFVLLSNEEKLKWLGKCDKKTGCISCVVNAQCDDHNGCSTDSCVQQYCTSVLINNAWCDPKLSTQPIYYQSIPGLRTSLELAGYDINKLVN